MIVVDKAPAEDTTPFPDSAGLALDAATLLTCIEQHFSPACRCRARE